MSEGIEEKNDEYREFEGARVLWPPGMTEDTLLFIINMAKSALQSLSVEKDGNLIAEQIKTALDREYGNHWHVILGKAFGCHAIHEKNGFCYFQLQKISFLCYKAGSG